MTGNFAKSMLQVRMLRFATVLLVLLCASAPVAAQVRISPEDCARAVQHIPEVSATYVPGVDAQGRAVAPADLAPPVQVLPERLWFVLSVDLARRLNLPGGLKGDLPLGIISVEGGQVLFDGRPLAPGTDAALAAACARARR